MDREERREIQGQRDRQGSREILEPQESAAAQVFKEGPEIQEPQEHQPHAITVHRPSSSPDIKWMSKRLSNVPLHD